MTEEPDSARTEELSDVHDHVGYVESIVCTDIFTVIGETSVLAVEYAWSTELCLRDAT